MADNADYFVEITNDGEEMSLDKHVRFVSHPGSGGVATFSGNVRESNEGRTVEYLEYDCYEPMTRKELHEILQEAQRKWNDRGKLRFAVSHRTGRVDVGEPAVVVAVSAPHRAEALEACRYVIDELKGRAPIWKKEHFEDGDVWVENPDAPHGKETSS